MNVCTNVLFIFSQQALLSAKKPLIPKDGLLDPDILTLEDNLLKAISNPEDLDNKVFLNLSLLNSICDRLPIGYDESVEDKSLLKLIMAWKSEEKMDFLFEW